MKAFHKTAALFTLSLVVACPVTAGTVSFSGTVINTCVINISTPGALGMASSGTTLSSGETGGVDSILAIVATGSTPTLQFGVPTMTGPAGSTAGATKMIGYASPGGANQALTSGTSSYAMNRLLDTLTVKATATNPSGFATGLYGINATVTCQQL